MLGQLSLMLDLVIVLLGKTSGWTDAGVGSVIADDGLGRCVARGDIGLDCTTVGSVITGDGLGRCVARGDIDLDCTTVGSVITGDGLGRCVARGDTDLDCTVDWCDLTPMFWVESVKRKY